MNIFFLDYNLTKCAEYHVDRHVVKIIIEVCSMLATAYPQGVAPYKRTHANHPMSVWVRESRPNFLWTIDYGKALCKEYTYRYNKRHKSENVLDWYANNIPEFARTEPTSPPRCFGTLKGVIPETSCIVSDYRNYYLLGKQHLFSWKGRERPDWINN